LSDDLKVKGDAIFLGARMDFSGIAKGYITDQIVEFLTKQQWKNFLVDSGGDIFMRGVDEENNPWTVNVEGIDEKKLMFALSNKAIATSGIGKRRWEIEGKRMHHIINPRKPAIFSFDLKSVSIIADSTVDADVWAKTIFLMGKEDGMLYAREHSIAAVVLDSRGSAWISPKAKEFVH
jgi:thiamine biosynthesis lipoprotein